MLQSLAYQRHFHSDMPGRLQVLLFVPACTLAPLCAGMDVQREAWLRLVLWTLERAGAGGCQDATPICASVQY